MTDTKIMTDTMIDLRHTPCNVLFVAHDAALYGAQKSLLEIIGRVDRKRFNPLVMAPSAGPFTQALNELGVSSIPGFVQRWIFHPKPMTIYAALRRPWRRLNHPYLLTILSLVTLPFRLPLLVLFVRRHRIRLVYTNTATVLDGALVARLCKIPHVWHLRERIADNRDLASLVPVTWVPDFILRYSTVVITNSHTLARQFFGGALPAKLRVIHNGVDIERFQHSYPVLDMPDFPDHVRLTAVCGVVQEQKDILTYIRAAARLCDSHPELHHLVIGRWQHPYRLKLEAEITKLGLNSRIHFLGYRSDIPALFSIIDILVSASVYETFGRTLIEGMAAGKPVISTRSGGPEEIIEDGKDGFLVDVGDDAAMAARIAELLDNPQKMQAMSVAARQRAETHFDLQQVVRRIETIFSDALKA